MRFNQLSPTSLMKDEVLSITGHTVMFEINLSLLIELNAIKKLLVRLPYLLLNEFQQTEHFCKFSDDHNIGHRGFKLGCHVKLSALCNWGANSITTRY